jgi:hypothetical protein
MVTETIARDPHPGVERAITQVAAGMLTQRELMIQFLTATLIVPSGKDFSSDASAFRPVVITRGGLKHMAVFTAEDYASTQSKIAPFAAELTGRAILAGLDPEMGLAVNPGVGPGFWLTKDTVGEIVRDLLGE